VAVRAQSVLERFLSSMSVSDLLRFARGMAELRQVGPYNPHYPAAWMELAADDVRALGPRWSDALVSVGTLHHSGYVRAAALKELARRSVDAALPFALLRVADWVAPIRQEALALVLQWMSAGNESSWVRALPVVNAVRSSERAPKTQLDARLRAYLDSAAGAAALDVGTSSEDAGVRRAAWGALLARSLTPEQLMRGLLDRDPFVSRRVAPFVTGARASPALLPVLRAGLRSRQPLIRRYCLDALAAELQGEARAQVLEGLMDRSARVRGVARYYAQSLGLLSDLGEFYVAALNDKDFVRVAVALEGLAETGASAKWPEARRFLESEARTIRRAALSAAAAFKDVELSRFLYAALAGEDAPMSQFARRMLIVQSALLNPSELVRIATDGKLSAFARVNATRLMADLPKWQQVISLLRTISPFNDPVRATALASLNRWNADFNRSAAQPSKSEVSDFGASLAKAESRLPDGLAEALRFSIKPWA
jgi:hypothetical protein